MAVPAGNLDPLVGALVPAGDLYSLHVESFTTSGNTVTSLTAVVGNSNSFEGDAIIPSATFTVSTVDNTGNSAQITPGTGISQTPNAFTTTYFLGYAPNAILVSALTDSNIALELNLGISPDISLGILSDQPLTSGSTVSFSSAGTFTDALQIVCYRAGTRIATPEGERVIDDIQPGDLVCARHAGNAQVEWIGRRHVDCRRHPEPRRAWPIRVSAGAFGDGRPYRDLWLSPDHAVFVQAVLIPIRYLVNGVTIAQVPCDEVTYFHLELAQHDIIMAEGLPAETLLPKGDRSFFENGDGPVQLRPDFHSLAWEAEGCAPLVVSGLEVGAVRADLSRHAAMKVA